jgi:predicted nucleotidyltransferase
VYGSRARGEAHEWSDLDVVVVSPRFEGQPFIDRWPTLFRALGSPAELEPICYTPEEFERYRQEPGIAATAWEEGIRLL